MNRWSKFTDKELYMLKRIAIESSYEIFVNGAYDEEERELYTSLLNELIVANSERD